MTSSTARLAVSCLACAVTNLAGAIERGAGFLGDTARLSPDGLPQVGPALQEATEAVANAVPVHHPERGPVEAGVHAALATDGLTDQALPQFDQPLERQLTGAR
jgi:hypothetical protein